MKLIEALKIAAANPVSSGAPPFEVALVCGFTPLHLQTFFTAHLRERFPERRISIRTGLFGDVAGTLTDLRGAPVDAVAVVLEWPDVDQRLGIRQLGGWSPQSLADIVERGGAWLDHMLPVVRDIAAGTPVVISLPTLPFPPIFFTAPWQAGVAEASLRAKLWTFAAAAASHHRIRILNPQALDIASEPSARLNVSGAWTYGFPYHNTHAERLAAALAQAVENRQPKKGVITDLDDTLWAGIVGDDGVEQISWDLDHHTQAHGLYQQLLSTLSEEGVLVGVASKNDLAVVEDAFRRDDLLLRKERVFPLDVGWGSKADAIGRVLAKWNIGGESVVFVDDNPIELAEVKAAHPAIECLRFPHDDPDAVYGLLIQLRELFGRNALSEEDALRLQSLRSGVESQDAAEQSDGYSESLLEHADAQLVLEFAKDAGDRRVFELISKTNQFNLNGRRPGERDWAEYVRDPRTFVLTASYKDRFGTLGKVAVLAGRAHESRVEVDTWVMSCRAFARRIEHQCLQAVFDRFDAQEMRFDYQQTPRNGPIGRFLASLQPQGVGAPLTVDAFRAACPRLFHRVVLRDASPAGIER